MATNRVARWQRYRPDEFWKQNMSKEKELTMSTMYSVGQMNQLGDALEAVGYSPDDVTKLRTSPHLAMIRGLIRGQVEVTVTKHIIDLDADPFIPDGWEVVEHQKGGQFEWDPAKVALYLSPNQQGDKTIKGDKLRQELKDRPVYNANQLDYLLANPQLIPDSWKSKAVFFWGTIYRDSDGGLYVRYLYWGGDRWVWGFRWLGRDWRGDDPAAVPASN